MVGIVLGASTAHLVGVAVLGVALLLFLIVVRRLHAFVALLVTSLAIGLAAQWPDLDPARVLSSMQAGMAGTLGFVAVIVGLGAMFGHMLESSGGAEVLAHGLLERFGVERAPWALGLAGFLISIPVFFDVGFVIMVPLLYGLSRRTGRPLMGFAIPLLAGMAVTHSFMPPTPGPMAVAAILDADLGYVIAFGAIVGLPCTIVAGPLLGRVIARRVPGTIPAGFEPPPTSTNPPPSLGAVLGLVALPIALILGHTWAGTTPSPSPSVWTVLATLLGHPFVALLLTTLLCFHVLGTRRGLAPERVREIAAKALEPAGIIILVTGAGGVLKQVMIDTEVGKALADQLTGTAIPPVLIAFAMAMMIRIMQGSVTVAMLTSAGLVVPLLEPLGPSAALKGLLVIAIASGATCVSHVNDSGFWLVNRFLGLSVEETLRSWTLVTAVVGLVGLLSTLAISAFV